MAWFIFRHTQKLGPLRFTVSNRGLTTSVGNRFFRASQRTDGTTTTTARIPGTGISWRRTRK